MAKKNIITVDASHLAVPPRYVVMMNPTYDEIVDCGNEYPGVVVFPFFVGPKEFVPELLSVPGILVVPSFYLGEHPKAAHEHLIAACVTSVFRVPLDQCERVL